MKVKTNRPRDSLRERELKGREMIRGERVLLASCTVSSSTEKKKTTKESMAAEIIPASARAPSEVYSRSPKFKILSRILNSGTERTAARVETAGTTHSDDRRKLRRCLRKAHDIKIWSGTPNRFAFCTGHATYRAFGSATVDSRLKPAGLGPVGTTGWKISENMPLEL